MTDIPEPRHDRPFADFLREQSRGKLHRELTAALPDLIAAIVDTGKPGSITLTLAISLAGEGQVIVADKVTVKTPTHDRPTSFFYVGDGFTLTRDDPQADLFEGIEDAAVRQAREVAFGQTS